MAKNSKQSWKKDHPGTFLSNSVQKADRSVKQAMSHPEEIAVEHAFNSIARTEKALTKAEQYDERMDSVQQNKEQLDMMKKQLNEAQEIVEDQ
ncbi:MULTISPECIES: hypothetical protein [Sporosarcina]|uniref:Uncharacterized protein n=2 Tax=Sporosarcina newyorkensis TaxID=759851 RepID=A0A1T4YY95_9BACL|nr:MULTISPECIES: hypothetical protein [Sporosarcina]EGQ24038.1 hypothetical protein HMPREF9372_2620 [Sporosarcina newyorkensis 2681]MBY0223387.1 hypothetical protein [Sporosarcina aquimarina]SKB06734.1 hypothetical protein SAMN04244570_0227 [Sporosarcina newyorkensis]